MGENKISTVSKNYAKALIEIALEDNSFDKIKSQLSEILGVLNSSCDLQIVMDNSSISVAKKIEILDAVFGSKIDLKIMNFLKLLVEKNRFGELNSIVVTFNDLSDAKSNKKKVEIISSIDLDSENKDKILSALEKKLSCEVLPMWNVDESIIAGLKFKFDDYVIDTSVRNKIENLSKNISR